MSKLKRRMRTAGIATFACTAALGFSGCFQAAYDTYVQSGKDTVIKWHYSSQIVWHWAGSSCNVDLNGNGVPGGEQDRGWCALRLIRSVACSKLSGTIKNACNAATADREWDDFNPAARAQAGPGADCLAVTINPLVNNSFNWTTRVVNNDGCQRGP